tara:strand:- start:91 stop:267 length:177 start_codon:yes stop_codon:yes gene_type:complete
METKICTIEDFYDLDYEKIKTTEDIVSLLKVIVFKFPFNGFADQKLLNECKHFLTKKN